NGASIPGATATTLFLSNVQPGDGGNYSLAASNMAGMITSSVAVLTVQITPAFTLQPQSRTNNQGTDAIFSVTAIGTQPLSYQWQFNGANLVNGNQLTGATSPTLSLGYVLPANAGSYSVLVSNAAGIISSAPANLQVMLPNCSPVPSGLSGWWPADGSA